MKRIIILVIICSITAGCAHGVKDAPLHYGKEINLEVFPADSFGVRKTPNLEAGDVTVVAAPMSDTQIGSEMYPGRVSYPGWAGSKVSGWEGYAQYIHTGNYPSGTFMAFVMMDGKFSETKDARFLPLSSRTDYTWDENGFPVPINRLRFYDEKPYRDELLEKYGTPINKDTVFIDGFADMVKSWNVYSTDRIEMYSTLEKEDIEKIAAINPGYTAVGKLVLRNKTVVSLNPVQMVSRASITVYDALMKRSKGFDPDSEISRNQMGIIVQLLGNFRMEMIRGRNELIAKQNAEIEDLRKKLDDAVLLQSTSIEDPLQQLTKPPLKKTAERRKR